ncbi:MAG: hypothetical protein HY303_07575 [Candidatus Wallbacteria bacterium]|nr:hypothetical protein [Candidatus Wallbacteria bacterium]
MLRLVLAALLLVPAMAWAVNEAEGGGGASPASRASLEGLVVQVSAKTDAHGHFRVHGLEPGDYEYSLAGSGFQPMRGKFTAKTKEALKRNFFVQQYNKFYGTVKEAAVRAGTPKVAKAAVVAQDGAAGATSAVARPPEAGTDNESSEPVSENGDPGFLAAAQSPDVAGSKPSAQASVQAPKAGGGSPGKPVAGADVQLRPIAGNEPQASAAKQPPKGGAPAKPSSPHRSAKTDAKGAFDFGHVADGVFEVTISKKGYHTLRRKLEIAHWRKQDFELEPE